MGGSARMTYVADYDKTPMPAQANMGVVIGSM